MLKEQWIKWQLPANKAIAYRFHSFTENSKESTILLVDSDNAARKLEVTPQGLVLAYRKVSFPSKQDIVNWPIFKIINSNFVQFLSDESYGIFSSNDFNHFTLITIDSTIDVVCGLEPVIKIV